MAPAAESAIGNERDLFAEPLAHDGAGRRKHLAHAGTAAWSFITNYDHVAGFHRAVEDSMQRRFFAVENNGASIEPQAFLAGNFRNRAFRRKIAAQDDQMAVLLNGFVERLNDCLPGDRK